MKIPAPQSIPLSDILPKKEILLMGAGPVPIPKIVAEANSRIMSHLGVSMKQVVSRVIEMGQYVFQTSSTKIFGISGPSSAAMEMATSSLLWPGRKILVLNLGTFSGRFSEIARGVGAEVKELFTDEHQPFKAEQVRAELEQGAYDVLALVQGETSCGVKNIELEAIVKLAKNFNVKTIVDAVCTLSTMELPMDEWGIDVVVVGGQKGFSGFPGVSMIAYSEEAFEFVSRREVNMPHWCLDPRRAHKFWGKGEYHYTAPVSGIFSLHEALRLICEETLEKRFVRHHESSSLLQAGLESMGMELLIPKEYRLNSVVAVKNFSGVNTKELIQYLVTQQQVEISGAFGLDIIRIGQMGEQCRPENIRRVIEALGAGYENFGVKLQTEEALMKLQM